MFFDGFLFPVVNDRVDLPDPLLDGMSLLGRHQIVLLDVLLHVGVRVRVVDIPRHMREFARTPRQHGSAHTAVHFRRVVAIIVR